MPYVKSGGLQIYYEVIGNGPPVVLHHGTMGSSEIMKLDGYVDALSDNFQVVLFDARGHGKSDKPLEKSEYTIDKLAGDVVAVLDDIGLSRAGFWGYSWGARVGFGLGDLAPNRFKGFVLGAGQPYVAQITTNLDEHLENEDAMRDAFLGIFGLTPETIPAPYSERILANNFRAVYATLGLQIDAESAIKNMTMPCLLYAGSADPVFENTQKAANELPNARFVSLEGMNHMDGRLAFGGILSSAKEIFLV